MATILLDLDNTLIETARFRLTEESEKLWKDLEELRSSKGINLVGFTSRPRFLKVFTLFQLRNLGIKLDKLIMAKPRGDCYIGNRAINFDCRNGNADATMIEVWRLLNG
jgi:hypothetical protein